MNISHQIHHLVLLSSFASSKYLSLEYFSPMFLYIYIIRITNTAQYLQIKFFHVSLYCNHIWCITSTMAGSMSQHCPLATNMNKQKMSWTVSYFHIQRQKHIICHRNLQLKNQKGCVSVRILPEKYDSHPLNLQWLQPMKVSLGPERILERPSKRSSVTAMSVLRSANPDTTQRIKRMSSSTEVCIHPYYLKVIRFCGFMLP